MSKKEPIRIWPYPIDWIEKGLPKNADPRAKYLVAVNPLDKTQGFAACPEIALFDAEANTFLVKGKPVDVFAWFEINSPLQACSPDERKIRWKTFDVAPQALDYNYCLIARDDDDIRVIPTLIFNSLKLEGDWYWSQIPQMPDALDAEMSAFFDDNDFMPGWARNFSVPAGGFIKLTDLHAHETLEKIAGGHFGLMLSQACMDSTEDDSTVHVLVGMEEIEIPKSLIAFYEYDSEYEWNRWPRCWPYGDAEDDEEARENIWLVHCRKKGKDKYKICRFDGCCFVTVKDRRPLVEYPGFEIVRFKLMDDFYEDC